jgi:predicted Zn finger-like uncharacterized protein
MLIICPTCASEYTLDAEKIGEAGRRVRCIQCQTIWVAQRPSENTAESDWSFPDPAPEPAVDQFAFVPVPDAASVTDAAWAEAAQDEPDVAAALANQVHQPDEADSEADLEAVAAAADNSTAITVAQPVPAKSRKSKASTGPLSDNKGRWFMRPLKALASPAAISVLGLSIIGFGIMQRNAVVRAAPALGPVFEMVGLPANIRGLSFQNVTSETVTTGPDRFLVIEGVIAGTRKDRVPVPQIELVVRDASAKSLYTWAVEPPRSSLIPGDTMRFRARLASPPENGHDVMVRFVSTPAPDKGGPKPGEKSASDKTTADKTASPRTALMQSAQKP